LVVTLALLNIFFYLEVTLGVCASLECQTNTFRLTPQLTEQLRAYQLAPLFWAGHIFLLDTLLVLSYAAVAGYIFSQRSDDWLALLCGLLLILLSSQAMLSNSRSFLFEVPLGVWIARATTLGMLLTTLHFLLLFPNGRSVPSWGMGLIYLAVGADVLRQISTVDTNDLFSESFAPRVLLLIPGVIAQIYRYRTAATPAQRQQLKWVMLGSTTAVVLVLMTAIVHFFVLPNTVGNTLWLNVLNRVVYFGGLWAFLAGLAFSILRYRIWQVDLVLNRSLIFGVLTLVMIGVFFACVIVLQTLIRAVLGQELDILATILATGCAAVSFNPLRLRLQHVIDRQVFGLRQDLHELALQAAQRSAFQRQLSVGKLTGLPLQGYTLDRLLGRGGMGEVYLAYANERPYAVKVLAEHLVLERQFLQRFEREAQTVQTLDHPHIVRVYAAGHVAPTLYYIVMEYVAGEDVAQRLKQQGAIPLPQAIGIISAIADALDYAHARGIVHRDIKPTNIMLNPLSDAREERAVLMDFGIIKLADGSTSITETGLVGTLDYAAPEQIMNSGQVDLRADVYGLGVVAYQLLTGELPFKGSVGELVFAHLHQPPPDPRAKLPTLPSAIARAIVKALAKDRAERFASAGAFAAALRQGISSS
jgi:serine/threonine-protein kinase